MFSSQEGFSYRVLYTGEDGIHDILELMSSSQGCVQQQAFIFGPCFYYNLFSSERMFAIRS